eukprot:14357947-Ditylum_brightwellii.AAC.1
MEMSTRFRADGIAHEIESDAKRHAEAKKNTKNKIALHEAWEICAIPEGGIPQTSSVFLLDQISTIAASANWASINV